MGRSMEMDFRIHQNTNIEAEICIIGAGAAGIALADALRGENRDILLIESGGIDPSRETAILSEGETAGLRFTGLTEGRSRCFGGATRLWAGQCIRLDPMDFERRDWVPNSGWPIHGSDLKPFYERAERFLKLRDPIYDERNWNHFGMSSPAFRSELLATKFTIFCRQPDFKAAHLQILRRDESVRVMLHATVTRLKLAPDGTRILSASLRNLQGRRAEVTAQLFILCAGAIEIPRLLLASNDVAAAGIGNLYDKVGRFFQDHPTGRTVELELPPDYSFEDRFSQLRRGGEWFWPKLALGSAAQKSLRVLNANAYPVYDYSAEGDASSVKKLISGLKNRRFDKDWLGGLVRTVSNAPSVSRQAIRLAVQGRAPIFSSTRCWLQVHIEQAPNPNSRVLLAESVDALGMPKVKVCWSLGELERQTLIAMVEVVGKELQRTGLAQIKSEDWRDRIRVDAYNGLNDAFHHAGTTRMSASIMNGVVDPDCRVHGVSNLYVAGGSVFPTCGYANPTLTIIALALRLGDHIALRSSRRLARAKV